MDENNGDGKIRQYNSEEMVHILQAVLQDANNTCTQCGGIIHNNHDDAG